MIELYHCHIHQDFSMKKCTLTFLLALLVAVPALAEPFSKTEQKIYLKECVGDDATMHDYCDCTLTEMQKRMSVAEFRALGELDEDKIMDDEKFSDSIAACSDKIQ